MYTDPVIVHNDNGKTRSYVKVFFSGKRYRFYNGKVLGIKCFPNEVKNPTERMRVLQQLQYELKKQLEKGWNPGKEGCDHDPYAGYTLIHSITTVLQDIQTEDISPRYRDDMERVGKELQRYLRKVELTRVESRKVDVRLLERFLSSYNTSSAYYMTKRSTLAGLFTRMVRKGIVPENLVYKTTRKKAVPSLNAIFTKAQLRIVLDHLKKAHPGLHLCALLMYGCFLRPHREIRYLKRKHLNDDCTTITLGGDENKSKRIRVIRLPKYITQELQERKIQDLGPEYYVITQAPTSYNKDYFKTAWGRLKEDLQTSCSLGKGQTLYSFRHTGAVEVYQKTKDPYKVQQAMFHSSLAVTLTYLRSLGLVNTVSTEDLPEL